VLPEACAGKQAPGLSLPEGLVPQCLQHYLSVLLDPTPGKQSPKFLLPKDLVPLCLQQLPWILVAHTSKQATGLLLPAAFVLP
jgi:hypothetical protein